MCGEPPLPPAAALCKSCRRVSTVSSNCWTPPPPQHPPPPPPNAPQQRSSTRFTRRLKNKGQSMRSPPWQTCASPPVLGTCAGRSPGYANWKTLSSFLSDKTEAKHSAAAFRITRGSGTSSREGVSTLLSQKIQQKNRLHLPRDAVLWKKDLALVECRGSNRILALLAAWPPSSAPLVLAKTSRPAR